MYGGRGREEEKYTIFFKSFGKDCDFSTSQEQEKGIPLGNHIFTLSDDGTRFLAFLSTSFRLTSIRIDNSYTCKLVLGSVSIHHFDAVIIGQQT